MTDDDQPTPRPRWLTTAATTAILGRRPTDADVDSACPELIRSRLDRLGRRWYLDEDVQARAAKAPPPPRSASYADEVFARWAVDAKERAERIAAAHSRAGMP